MILPLRDATARGEEPAVKELGSALLRWDHDHEATILLDHPLAVDNLLALVPHGSHALDQVKLAGRSLLVQSELVAEVSDESLVLLLDAPREGPPGLQGLHLVHLRGLLPRRCAEKPGGHVARQHGRRVSEAAVLWALRG